MSAPTMQRHHVYDASPFTPRAIAAEIACSVADNHRAGVAEAVRGLAWSDVTDVLWHLGRMVDVNRVPGQPNDDTTNDDAEPEPELPWATPCLTCAPPPPPTGIGPDVILHHAVQVVGRYLDLDPEMILSRSHLKPYAECRRIVFWILRQYGLSLTAIGRAVERDHTTVLSAIRRLEEDPAELRLATVLGDLTHERCHAASAEHIARSA
jgi:hypothetical protein